MNCRFCNSSNMHEIIDLGHQPPSNALLTKAQLDEPETTYPLRLYVCKDCWLVQIPESKKAVEIFDESYPYFSSDSPANVSHAKEYVEMMVERFGVGKNSKVLEIGSNDGYLLQWFKERGAEVGGVDPAQGPAQRAWNKGIPTWEGFFNSNWARGWGRKEDLICGINVLNHQPDINDFVAGLKIALAPNGIITFEFPHVMEMVDNCQFDTIYHEHYSYFSFQTIRKIFETHGLTIFDVDRIPEHGGSLRIYATHTESRNHHLHFNCLERMGSLQHLEEDSGLFTVDYYAGFAADVAQIKHDLMSFLLGMDRDQTVVAYGAAAKGNTLLNYCGIRKDLVPMVVDISKHKQGKYLPGSHIPIVAEADGIADYAPDFVLVTPWNLKVEITKQLSYIRGWKGKFVIPIPRLEVLW
jgi:hypothetical protein